MKRTDIHKPSSIVPQDYVWVAFEHVAKSGDILGDCFYQMEQRSVIKAHMAKTGGTYSHHEHGGNCHICGADCIYTVLFYHEKSNSYIRTGMDCAEKLDMAVGGDFAAFKSHIKNALEAKAGKLKAQAILKAEGIEKAWDVYLGSAVVTQADGYQKVLYEESTIQDIVGKLIKYGSITPKTMNFLHVLLDKIEHRAELEAKRKAEREAALPCPAGRIEITGTVLKTDLRETAFGTTLKMLVKAQGGWMVWSTVPSKLAVEKGQEIKFVATLTPSPTDPKFGFASRPAVVA